MTTRRLALLAILVLPAAGADPGRDLLNAARRGQADRVRVLLEHGAPIETRDKSGRNALALAAENGHVEVLRLLLVRRGQTPPLRLSVDAVLAADNLYSSCSMSPRQLAQHVAGLQPEARVAAALREFAFTSGKGILELPSEDAGMELRLRVRPGASCVPQNSSDSLSMAIDAALVRKGSAVPIFEKTFGGGLKGLHARTVRSPAQYAPLFEAWARQHAPAIYWSVLAAMVNDGRAAR